MARGKRRERVLSEGGDSLNYRCSKLDKDFNMLEFAQKQLKADVEQVFNSKDEIQGYRLKNSYSASLDGLLVVPKTLVDCERDEVQGDHFKEINPKHQDYMKYGATDLLRLTYGISKEEAKNRGLKLIKNGYEDLREEQKKEEPQLEFKTNESGSILKIYENLDILLKYYSIKTKFNKLTKKVEIEGALKVDGSFDATLTKINTLCQYHGLKLSKDDRYSFVYCVARDNSYSSVIDYLEECEKKYQEKRGERQKGYVDELLEHITFRENEDVAFCKGVLKKMLLGAVKLAFNEGDSFNDFIVILKSKQGRGKTQFLKSLFPKDKLNEFFKEGVILNLNDKDSLIESTGYWFVELGEFGRTLKTTDRDKLKAFIGKATDEYRAPYGRTAEKYPRYSTMVGTINDSEFLRDEENRRFVVMEVEELNFKHDVNIDLMWGELCSVYKEFVKQGTVDKYTFLSKRENEINTERNKGYMVRSTEELILEEYIPFEQPKEQWRYITATLLTDYVEKESNKKLDPRRVGKALNSMGFDSERKHLNGSRSRYYLLPYIKDYSMPF